MTSSPWAKGGARRLHSSLSKVAACLCLSTIGVAVPNVAVAQTECAESPDECGRVAFDAGVKAYQEGDYPTALQHFREAFKYKPHPAVGLNLGLAESKNGMLLEAIARFDEVIAHPDASDNLRKAAQREKDTVEGNLAVLMLDVSSGGNVSATVDGSPMLGDPPTVRLNPGVHHMRVTEGDEVLLDRKVNLDLGERLRVAVQRSSEVKVVIPPKPKPPKPKPRSGVDPVWLYASAGVTVALGAATLWSGLDTRSAYNEYERDLPTLPQDEINRRVDEGNGKETRTNVLLGVTTLAAAGTAVLGIWFVDWEGAPESEPGNVALTPGGVLVRGRW